MREGVRNDKLEPFIRLMFEGELKQGEIAKKLGVTEKTLSQWKKLPEYEDGMLKLERRYLKGLSRKAIKTMEQLLEARSEKVRFDAAADILDRTGHKPVEQSEVEHSGGVIFVDDIKD